MSASSQFSASIALAIFLSASVMFAKKLSERDFPLEVDVQSFELRSFNTPLSYMGRVIVNIEGQQVIIQTSIDGKHYVISCTTQDVGCVKLMPGIYSGRWSGNGLEIFTRNEKGKTGKITYNVLSGGQ